MLYHPSRRLHPLPSPALARSRPPTQDWGSKLPDGCHMIGLSAVRQDKFGPAEQDGANMCKCGGPREGAQRLVRLHHPPTRAPLSLRAGGSSEGTGSILRRLKDFQGCSRAEANTSIGRFCRRCDLPSNSILMWFGANCYGRCAPLVQPGVPRCACRARAVPKRTQAP